MIPEDGWYGFTFMKADKTAFDFTTESNILTDYIIVSETLDMVQGNRMADRSTPSTNRLSSAYNLYLRKGTVIRFNGGNGASQWAISKPLDNTEAKKAEYMHGGWTSDTTYTVEQDGYYGLVVAFNSAISPSDEYTLLDYFTIQGYTK